MEPYKPVYLKLQTSCYKLAIEAILINLKYGHKTRQPIRDHSTTFNYYNQESLALSHF